MDVIHGHVKEQAHQGRIGDFGFEAAGSIDTHLTPLPPLAANQVDERGHQRTQATHLEALFGVRQMCDNDYVCTIPLGSV